MLQLAPHLLAPLVPVALVPVVGVQLHAGVLRVCSRVVASRAVHVVWHIVDVVIVVVLREAYRVNAPADKQHSSIILHMMHGPVVLDARISDRDHPVRHVQHDDAISGDVLQLLTW